jgi:hypothetical protein
LIGLIGVDRNPARSGLPGYIRLPLNRHAAVAAYKAG